MSTHKNHEEEHAWIVQGATARPIGLEQSKKRKRSRQLSWRNAGGP